MLRRTRLISGLLIAATACVPASAALAQSGPQLTVGLRNFGEGASGELHGGTTELVDPSPGVIELAERVCGVLPTPTLYARIDLVSLGERMEARKSELMGAQLRSGDQRPDKSSARDRRADVADRSDETADSGETETER